MVRGKTSNRVLRRRQNLKMLHWSVMTKMFRFGGDLGFGIGLDLLIFWDSTWIGFCLLAGYRVFLEM